MQGQPDDHKKSQLLDRLVWANGADSDPGAVLSRVTLFAMPYASLKFHVNMVILMQNQISLVILEK